MKIGFLSRFVRKAALAQVPLIQLFSTWASGLHSFLSGSRRNWLAEAGLIYDNSVVAICLNWYSRQISYPRLVVHERGEPVDSPLRPLIEDGLLYDGSALWAGTLLNYWVNGNAYWLKLRGASGKLLGFAWLPAHRCKVFSDEARLVAGLEFHGYDGKVRKIDRADLVVFQHGLHPEDQRVGISPLIGALRDLTVDNLASTLTAAVLDNNGVGASVINPKLNQFEQLQKEQYEMLALALRKFSTGDMAGRVLPVPFPVEVTQVEAKLKDMEFAKLRAEAAARICGAFGIDPMVVSLPSENKTYSNYAEANEAAHEQGLLPLLQRFAEALTRDVIPELHPGRGYIVDWDLSAVRALADDQDALYKRVADVWRAGIITRAEARQALGFEPKPGDDVYIADAMFSGVPLKHAARVHMAEAAVKARAAMRMALSYDEKNGAPVASQASSSAARSNPES